MSLALLLSSFVIAALLSTAFVELIRVWTHHRQILDHPGHRSSHTQPTPRGGGIAIVALTLFGLAFVQIFRPFTSWTTFAAFTIPALAIAIVSWIDDIRGTPASLRFAIHLGAAICAVIWLGRLQQILGIAGIAIAIVWIAGLTNAYNFMDGIDGIAGLQAVIAGAAWAFLGFRFAIPLAGLTGALIAGASLGFLIHNWSPARIFMGDVGSAFLGFTFAAITVLAAERDPRLAVCGVLLLWPFVLDTTITLIRRALRGERLHEAHRSHLYQRLNQRGWSHAQVSMLYGALGLIGAGAVFVWTGNS
ncbi:MAG TPA: glycosyltransferase family 4 protein [Thermoanaerobaculia bacterium]|nr:glycosyltransferase family 4 protein [Thermoanaerobaculia bacterium]